MRLSLYLIIATLFASVTLDAKPQSNSISGFVRAKNTGETLIGATVRLEGTNYGAITNKNGYYVIKDIKEGEYILKVTYLGYKESTEEINISRNQELRKDIKLSEGSVQSEEIQVTANKNDDKTQIKISEVNIPVEQIKEIRIGGESDVFRTLQLLPGVLTSSQISSGLYVRGGSPDQNLVLLDGSTVYNPTHLFGFISAFNTEAIKDVELIKGGFNAEYGGRLSSVLTITQKDGNREEFGGLFNVGVISSKLALEGPIGNGSWFLGGRRTYFELIKGLIPADPTEPIPDFNFYDLNGKITQDFGDDDKVSISGFTSSDRLEFADGAVDFGLGISNYLLALKWTHIFNPELFSTVNVSTSSYTNGFFGDNSGYEALVDNVITDYTIKQNVEWFTNENLNTKFGYEINFYEFNYLANLTGNADSTQQGGAAGSTNLNFDDVNYAAYAQAKYDITDLWYAQGGLRTTYFQLSDELTFDPRISMRYQLQPGIAIKGSWGIFHQNLKLATLQDFSFFDTWLGTDSTLDIARAVHYILSLETQPFEGYDLNFDVYYKTLQNITEIKRLALVIENGEDVLFQGEGESYGFEIFLQKKYGKLTGWLGYAFGFVQARFDSINFGQTFRPRYDRRHDFKVVAQYEINDSWNVGANFIFQSGQSYTGQTSRFQIRLPGQSYGRGKTVPSQRYGLRLPNSHQLNINGSYRFDLWGAKARAILDIFNVYNRRDLWFRFYDPDLEVVEVEDFRLLPILPTLSFEVKF